MEILLTLPHISQHINVILKETENRSYIFYEQVMLLQH